MADDEKKENRSLALPALSPEVMGKGLYRSVDTLVETFTKLRQHANVCFPVMKSDFIPPLHAVSIRPVAIDPRPGSADLYQDKRAQGKYALTKVALTKFAAALGVSWHPTYTRRVDDGKTPHLCRYAACGVYTSFDGTTRMVTKHKTVDLRDGSAQIAGVSEKEVVESRKHIDALCESKAMNRVIRDICGLQGAYTQEELTRPFVVAALVFTGESDNPLLAEYAAKAIVDKALGAQALFGPTQSATAQLPAPPEDPGDDDDDDNNGAPAATAGVPY